MKHISKYLIKDRFLGFLGMAVEQILAVNNLSTYITPALKHIKISKDRFLGFHGGVVEQI